MPAFSHGFYSGTPTFFSLTRGLPNIRTAPAIRFRIIGLLREDAAARGKTPCVIVDLGSGNGLFRRQIARSLPETRVVGIEISKLAYRWSVIFQRWSGLRKLEYRNLDFNAIDLGDADAGTHNIGRAGSQRRK